MQQKNGIMLLQRNGGGYIMEKQGEITLADLLNEEIKKELAEKKLQLKAEEERKKAEEEERKREERRRKEKNKSFAELLEESNLNWEDFK